MLKLTNNIQIIFLLHFSKLKPGNIWMVLRVTSAAPLSPDGSGPWDGGGKETHPTDLEVNYPTRFGVLAQQDAVCSTTGKSQTK